MKLPKLTGMDQQNSKPKIGVNILVYHVYTIYQTSEALPDSGVVIIQGVIRESD